MRNYSGKIVLLIILMALSLCLVACGDEPEAYKSSQNPDELSLAEKEDFVEEQEPSTYIEEPVKPEYEEDKEDDEDIPREYRAALDKAELYSEMMHMSKKGIYDQLVSEYGEDFPEDAAQYAIDNLQVDWYYNALKTAQSYAEEMSMSDSAIYDQLISEYGEQFTEEEARYAVDNLK